ncbi:MAG: LPS export ABC transporter periplasmic protein LptC [Magnetococcales bacterium]|nr:LPS export ABC transporter periplasmic protein LptC [Magnetococcales bacterium]
MSRRHVKYVFLGIALTVVAGLVWSLARPGLLPPPVDAGDAAHATTATMAMTSTNAPTAAAPHGAAIATTPVTPTAATPALAGDQIATTGHTAATVTGMHLVQDDGQRKKWSLTAKSAEKPDLGRVQALAPRLTLYSDKGTALFITADKGTLDNQSRAFAFIDDVHATDGQDLHLTTQALTYDPQRRLLGSDRPFRLVGRGFELTGIGFEVNQETQHVRVWQRVRVVFSDGFGDLV